MRIKRAAVIHVLSAVQAVAAAHAAPALKYSAYEESVCRMWLANDPLSERSLLACFSSSSEPSTHANSCGAAILITPTSVKLRRGPHSTEPSVLLGR